MSVISSPTIDTQLNKSIQNTIAEKTIFANGQKLIWPNLAERHQQVMDGGDDAEFVKMDAITPDVTALPDSSNPVSTQLGDESVTITVVEYGLPVQLAKRVVKQRSASTLADSVQVVATHMAESVDLLAGNAAIAGSNVRFANGRASAATLLTGDVMSRQEFTFALNQLKTQRAMPFKDGMFRAVLHPNSMSDVFASGTANDFIDLSKYADPSAILTGEIGMFHGFRVFSATQSNFDNLSAGAGLLLDRILNVFCGGSYLGFAWDELPAVKGVHDVHDRMDRFLQLYWKGTYGYDQIQEENGYRIECTSDYAANP